MIFGWVAGGQAGERNGRGEVKFVFAGCDQAEGFAFFDFSQSEPLFGGVEFDFESIFLNEFLADALNALADPFHFGIDLGNSFKDHDGLFAFALFVVFVGDGEIFFEQLFFGFGDSGFKLLCGDSRVFGFFGVACFGLGGCGG